MNQPTAAAPLGEARLYLRREMSEPETLSLDAGEVVIFTTARRPGRSPNQDAAAVIPLGDQSAVLLLADGMGGAAAGDRAAGIAVNRTTERLLAAGAGETSIRNALLDGIEEADREIRELELGAGTTIVAVEIVRGSIRSYHAGDSMAVLLDVDGRPRWRTPPHSPVGHAIEAGLLDEVRAMSHSSRHLLTNALGQRSMHMEIGAPRPLVLGDTLVLGSDGLFDNLVLSEIGDRVRSTGLRQAVVDLVGTATGRMINPESSDISKPDDLTVIAFRARPPEALGTLDFSPVESA